MEVWLQDEARIGQQGSLTRVWAEKGSRPRLVRQQQYEYAYIFGAACPSTGESVGLVLPSSNTEAMNLHLQAISERVAQNKHAVVIVDNAGWHHAGELQKFSNITLMYLPPYSPELNPQEQVWRQMRERYLANRCYKDYDDIVEAACSAWNNITSDKDAVKQLTSRDWLNI